MIVQMKAQVGSGLFEQQNNIRCNIKKIYAHGKE